MSRLAAQADKAGQWLQLYAQSATHILAIGKAGDAYFAWAIAILSTHSVLIPIDDSWPKNRVDTICTDLEDAGAVVKCIHVSNQPGVDSHNEQTESTWFCPRPRNAPAYMLFTSGSTGKPKGIVFSWHQYCKSLEWEPSVYEALAVQSKYPPNSPTTLLHAYSVSVIGGSDHALAVAHGYTSVCVSKLTFLDTSKVSQILHTWRIQQIIVTPSWFELMLDHPEVWGQLNEVMLFGEKTSRTLAQRVAQQMNGTTRVTVKDIYSQTECLRWVAERDLKRFGETGKEHWRIRRGIECAIRDNELVVRNFLMMGYFPNVSQQLKEHYTGDRVSGTVESFIIESRLDSMVKIRGYRVDLGEVEVLLRAALGRRVCAFEQDGLLVACVEGEKINEAELQQAESSMPDYFTPHRYHFEPMFLIGGSGKLDRQSLRQLSLGGDVDHPPPLGATASRQASDGLLREQRYQGATDAPSKHLKPSIKSSLSSPLTVQEAFAQIFPQRTVTDDSSFKRLGGTSLDLVKLARLLKSISPSDVFSHDSVSQLQALVDSRVADSRSGKPGDPVLGSLTTPHMATLPAATIPAITFYVSPDVGLTARTIACAHQSGLQTWGSVAIPDEAEV
jgi:acyl-coenzyme A synthetase/AMP-(fatty) acid ligase